MKNFKKLGENSPHRHLLSYDENHYLRTSVGMACYLEQALREQGGKMNANNESSSVTLSLFMYLIEEQTFINLWNKGDIKKVALSLSKLAKVTHYSRSLINRHLEKLEEKGWITIEKEGNKRVYSVDFDKVNNALESFHPMR